MSIMVSLFAHRLTCVCVCVCVCACACVPSQPPAAGGPAMGSRLAWALPVGSAPACALAPPSSRPPLGPVSLNRGVRPRRDGDPNGDRRSPFQNGRLLNKTTIP